MKISFIGAKDNDISIFSELANGLSKKVSGLELSERFVPVLDDLPIVALEEAEVSDFIFVFAIIEDNVEKNLIEEKLIDVEIKTNVRILKEINENSLSSLDEGDYLEEKDVLVKDLSQKILDILFNETAFEPEDKYFGL